MGDAADSVAGMIGCIVIAMIVLQTDALGAQGALTGGLLVLTGLAFGLTAMGDFGR